jgi:hypothetical protein
MVYWVDGDREGQWVGKQMISLMYFEFEFSTILLFNFSQLMIAMKSAPTDSHGHLIHQTLFGWPMIG